MLTKEKWIRYCKNLHQYYKENPDTFLIPKSYEELVDPNFINTILTVAEIEGFDINFND